MLLYFALFYAYYRNPSEDKLLTDAEREFIAEGGAQPEDRASRKGSSARYLLRQRKVWGLPWVPRHTTILSICSCRLPSIFPPHCTWICFNQRSIPVCPGCSPPSPTLSWVAGSWYIDSARLERGPCSSNRAHRRNDSRSGNSRPRHAHTVLSPHFSGSAFYRRIVRRFRPWDGRFPH